MTTEPITYVEITPVKLLNMLCDGRSAVLVPWCAHYGVDIAHTLDVLEGRDEANYDLRQSLIAYCWLNRDEAQSDPEPEAQVPADASANVVYISDLLNDLIEEAA